MISLLDLAESGGMYFLETFRRDCTLKINILSPLAESAESYLPSAPCTGARIHTRAWARACSQYPVLIPPIPPKTESAYSFNALERGMSPL